MSDDSLGTLALVALGGGIALVSYFIGVLVTWIRDRNQ